MLESDKKFECPYCGEANTLKLDLSAGKRQVLVTDCEVCCKPIKVTAEIDIAGGVLIDARQEDEDMPGRSGLR